MFLIRRYCLQCLSPSFCSVAIPQHLKTIVVVDEWGRRWACTLRWRECLSLDLQMAPVSMACFLGGDWSVLYKTRRLRDGQRIRLGVSRGDSTTLYLSIIFVVD